MGIIEEEQMRRVQENNRLRWYRSGGKQFA